MCTAVCHFLTIPFFAVCSGCVTHPSQVSLYLLLMEDRYGQPCDMGVLWNVNDGPMMHAVQRVQGELGVLLMHRNRLAAHMVGTVRAAPPMLHDNWQCGRCYAKATCALYHKVRLLALCGDVGGVCVRRMEFRRLALQQGYHNWIVPGTRGRPHASSHDPYDWICFAAGVPAC